MKIYLSIVTVVIIILFTSCARPVYIMNPHNVSGFEKAKEIKASGSISSQEENMLGIHLNVAYSINDNFALIGSGSYINHSLFAKANGVYSELAGGYYKNFNKRIVFESYIGYGNGSTKSEYSFNAKVYDFRLKYHSFFNQSSITFKGASQYFEGIISLRTSRVNHYSRCNGQNGCFF